MALRTCLASMIGSLRSLGNANFESGRSFFSAVLSAADFFGLDVLGVPRAFFRLRRAASFCFVVAITDLLVTRSIGSYPRSSGMIRGDSDRPRRRRWTRAPRR